MTILPCKLDCALSSVFFIPLKCNALFSQVQVYLFCSTICDPVIMRTSLNWSVGLYLDLSKCCFCLKCFCKVQVYTKHDLTNPSTVHNRKCRYLLSLKFVVLSYETHHLWYLYGLLNSSQTGDQESHSFTNMFDCGVLDFLF